MPRADWSIPPRLGSPPSAPHIEPYPFDPDTSNGRHLAPRGAADSCPAAGRRAHELGSECASPPDLRSNISSPDQPIRPKFRRHVGTEHSFQTSVHSMDSVQCTERYWLENPNWSGRRFCVSLDGISGRRHGVHRRTMPPPGTDV